MDFTELYKQSSNLCRFSPNGLYLATAVQFRLVIRDAETLQILHLFACTDTVQHVSWSPDSELVCCASFKLGVVQVWSVKDEEWTGKIEEGVTGCVGIVWAPDARHLLSFSDFQVLCQKHFCFRVFCASCSHIVFLAPYHSMVSCLKGCLFHSVSEIRRPGILFPPRREIFCFSRTQRL